VFEVVVGCLEVAIGHVRFRFGRVGSGKFDQKNYRVTDRVQVNLIWVGSSFGSNIIGFFRISGHFGSGRVRFHVLSSSGHLGPDRVGFQIIWYRVISGSGYFGLGRVKFFFVMFYLGQVESRVGLDFRSSDFKFFFRNSV
jgi:hypothetical protein